MRLQLCKHYIDFTLIPSIVPLRNPSSRVKHERVYAAGVDAAGVGPEYKRETDNKGRRSELVTMR